jgi:hypothetical protein
VSVEHLGRADSHPGAGIQRQATAHARLQFSDGHDDLLALTETKIAPLAVPRRHDRPSAIDMHRIAADAAGRQRLLSPPTHKPA